MLSSATGIKRRRVYVALVCALLSAVALVVAQSSFSTTQPQSQTAVLTVAPAPALTLPIQNRLEAEHVTLRPTGFEPVEITRPAGRFLLAVNDRSGDENVTLLLVRGGDVVTPVRMRERPRKFEWRQVVNLPAGRYELREAAHPEWRCQITITGN